jgi:hypothetical protein
MVVFEIINSKRPKNGIKRSNCLREISFRTKGTAFSSSQVGTSLVVISLLDTSTVRRKFPYHLKQLKPLSRRANYCVCLKAQLG